MLNCAKPCKNGLQTDAVVVNETSLKLQRHKKLNPAERIMEAGNYKKKFNRLILENPVKSQSINDLLVEEFD